MEGYCQEKLAAAEKRNCDTSTEAAAAAAEASRQAALAESAFLQATQDLEQQTQAKLRVQALLKGLCMSDR